MEAQKGGKTKKRQRKRKSKKTKTKRKKSKRVQKGGLGFLNRFNPFSQKVVKDNDNESNNLVESRNKNRKQVKDFIELINDTKSSSVDLLPGSNVKIGYVPTNLSKTDECKSGKLNITVNTDDSKFKDFLKKHQEFENHYYNSSVDLLNFLESTILKQNKKREYAIKKFDLDQLNAVEKNVREKLLKYYTKCQELFTQSFLELSKAVGVKSSSNSIENENIDNVAVEINNIIN